VRGWTHILLRMPCFRQVGVLRCVDNMAIRDVKVVRSSERLDGGVLAGYEPGLVMVIDSTYMLRVFQWALKFITARPNAVLPLCKLNTE